MTDPATIASLTDRIEIRMVIDGHDWRYVGDGWEWRIPDDGAPVRWSDMVRKPYTHKECMICGTIAEPNETVRECHEIWSEKTGYTAVRAILQEEQK